LFLIFCSLCKGLYRPTCQ